jgi:hypothetical protein
MFGFEDPPFTISEIDRRIRRAPNQPCPQGGEMLELMSYPLKFTVLGSFDHEAVAGPHGYDYMQSHLAKTAPHLCTLYTPQYFQQYLESGQAYKEKLATFPSIRENIVDTPSPENVQYLLKERGCSVVITQFDGGDESGSHLTVAYEATETNTIRFYNPCFPGEPDTFVEVALTEIDGISLCDDLIGISFLS